MKRLIVFLCFLAASGPTLAYSPIYGDYVLKEAKACRKGDYVRLAMLDGSTVIGKWAGYVGYDSTVFVTSPDDWLATGYDIDHIVAITLLPSVAGNI
jgi:hypothetical protein